MILRRTRKKSSNTFAGYEHVPGLILIAWVARKETDMMVGERPKIVTRRIMRQLAVGGLLCVMLWGCGEDPAQLLATAQFEEQQHNLLHAQELYEQIMREFPDSAQAETAKQRMAELRKMPPVGK